MPLTPLSPPSCESIDESIDAHGLKVQRRGVAKIFVKISREGQGFRDKITRGSPILGFIAFFLKCFLKFAWGWVLCLPPSPFTSPCVHLCWCRSASSSCFKTRLQLVISVGQMFLTEPWPLHPAHRRPSILSFVRKHNFKSISHFNFILVKIRKNRGKNNYVFLISWLLLMHFLCYNKINF